MYTGILTAPALPAVLAWHALRNAEAQPQATWGGGIFVDRRELSQLEFGVAANRMLVWPEIQQRICAAFAESAVDTPFALDFGCATGGFLLRSAAELHHGRFLGLDSDSRAIATAQESLAPELTARVSFRAVGADASLDDLVAGESAAAVSASLVVNYLDETQLRRFFSSAAATLSGGGRLLIADLNPQYVAACLNSGIIYEAIDLRTEPAQVRIKDLADVQARLWTLEKYTELARAARLVPTVVAQPIEQSREYLQMFDGAFPDGYPRHLPRYRLFEFQKN